EADALRGGADRQHARRGITFACPEAFVIEALGLLWHTIMLDTLARVTGNAVECRYLGGSRTLSFGCPDELDLAAPYVMVGAALCPLDLVDAGLPTPILLRDILRDAADVHDGA